MLKKILQQQLVDIEGLLLLQYKSLNINELQAVLILLVLRLEKMKQPYITTNLLSHYMNLNEKEIDRLLVTLINQQLLCLEGNSISSKPLVNAILKNQSDTSQNDQPKKLNLIETFEKEFARALTPIEIETIKEWKQCQYSDQMIIEALKEATLSHVHNMRYIEKILVEWAKHGMKTTGRQTIQQTQKAVDLVDYEWWKE